jgi:hypothetical protein
VTKPLIKFILALTAALVIPHSAHAQNNVPPAGQRAEDAVEDTVHRLRMGVSAGVALDPELIDFGVHASFGPIFKRGVDFRPGVEFGIGELTTLFGINLDVLYTFGGYNRQTRWIPYVGAGPNFSLSHKGFSSDNVSATQTTTTTTTGTTANTISTTTNRFNFSDTNFDAGFNFIAGARRQNGMFIEMKATAYGVSNVRLLVGYNF